MKQIKYNNKQANNATTPSGIFTADNANEIKNVVNANALEVITNYATKHDIIKAQAEYHAFTGLVITNPAKQNSWTFLLGGHTYQQASGGNITVPVKTLAVANYINSTWVKAGEIDIPQQITLFSFNGDLTYKAGDTIAYLNKIFRVKASIVSTQQIPSLTSTDWEVLGGYNILEIDGKLTVINAEITALKNNKVDKVAGKSLLDDNQIAKLLNDYTKAEIDSKVLEINTAINTKVAGLDTKITNANSRIDNANTEITALKNNKVDKIAGKELSTNDFTDVHKDKVDLIKSAGEEDKYLNEKGEYKKIIIPKAPVQGLNLNSIPQVPDVNGIVHLETKEGTVQSITLNGNKNIPDASGDVSITIDVPEVDESLNIDSTNPVANSAVTSKINDIENSTIASMDAEVSDDETKVTLSLINKNGDIFSSVEIPAGTGGGGGEQESATKIVLSSVVDNPSIKFGDRAKLYYTYDHIFNSGDEKGTSTGIKASILITAKNGATEVYRQTINDVSKGVYEVDLTNYLQVGTTDIYVKATVTTVEGTTQTKQSYVSVKAYTLTLASSFSISNNLAGYQANETVTIPFSVGGIGNKTVLMYVDGLEKDTRVITKSGTTNGTFTLPLASYATGRHTIQMVCELAINTSLTIKSQSIYFDIYKGIDSNVHIATKQIFNDGRIFNTSNHLTPTLEIGQYDQMSFDFAVYDPLLVPAKVSVYNNNVLSSTVSVPRTTQVYNNRFNNQGLQAMRFESGTAKYYFNVNVVESTINISEVTDSLALKLSASGRSNNELNPAMWEFGNIKTTFNNFDWSSNGWTGDALKLTNGANINIPFKPFLTDASADGKTIEFEFTVSNVLNKGGAIITCMNNNTGFDVSTQEALIKSVSGAEVNTKFGTDLSFKVAFVINKKAGNRLLQIYVNGIICGAVRFGNADSFIQNVAQNIDITSDNADVLLRNIRVYNRALNDDEELANYIVDRETTIEMVQVYRSNDILTDDEKVSLDKLRAQGKSVLRLVGDVDLVNQTNNKKFEVPVTAYYYSGHGKEFDFILTGGGLRIQGTSSTTYPRKNYRLYFDRKDKYNTVLTVNGVEQTELKYRFKPDARPVSLFTFKADFAESSSTHNTGLARLLNDAWKLSGFLTPPQKVDATVRTGIDGFPMDAFYDNDGSNFNKYLGKYNFNNDKSASADVFGFEGIAGFNDSTALAGGENKCVCLEFLNNSLPLGLFKSDDMSGFADALEFRYPEDLTYINASAGQKTAIQRLWTWVKSCENNNAKFIAEASQYFDIDSLTAWYVATEYFMMCDQRVKNMMLVTWDWLKWYFVPYDSDTILGVRNDGKNVYDYTIDEETFDTSINSYAFAGHDSILWKLVRTNLKPRLELTAQTIRANMSKETVLKMFNTEMMANWSERIYNKDAEYKYITPLIENDLDYLYSLQGSRYAHRSYIINNRFDLLDAKYLAGTYRADNLRIYFGAKFSTNKQNISIVASEKYYFGYGYTSGTPHQSGVIAENAGATVKLLMDSDLIVNDPQYFYGASRMKEIDLRNVAFSLVNNIDFSNCRALQKIDLSCIQTQTTLTSLTLTANQNLKELNITGLINPVFSQLDLSKNGRLEKLVAGNTRLTGVTFAEGAPLTSATLPSTLQTLKLKSLNKLTNAGLVLTGTSNITRLWVEDCKLINWETIFNTLTNVQYIRIGGINITGDVTFLNKFINLGGIDGEGNIVSTPRLMGKFQLTKFIDDADLQMLRTKFPELDIKQPEYSTYIIYDKDPTSGSVILDSKNVYNPDNQTGYSTNKAYLPTGHLVNILKKRHRYLGKQGVKGTMTIAQLHDNNSHYFNDAIKPENATPALLDGTDGDIWMYEPHYWYKGVTDFKNKVTYAYYSSYEEMPSKPVDSKKLTYTDLVDLGNVEGSVYHKNTITNISTKSTDARYQIIKVNVKDYKKVKFQTSISHLHIPDILNACFTTVSGNVLEKITNLTPSIYNTGADLIYDIPATAEFLYVSCLKTYVEFSATLSKTTDLFDLEMDWVEHKEVLVAPFQTSLVNDKYRVVKGNTWTALPFDLVEIRLNARGFTTFDYNTKKDISNLAYFRIGDRNIREYIGITIDQNLALYNGGSSKYGMGETARQGASYTSYYTTTNDLGEITYTWERSNGLLGYEGLYNAPSSNYSYYDLNTSYQVGDSPNYNTTMVHNLKGREKPIYSTPNYATYIRFMMWGKYLDLMRLGTEQGSNTTFYCTQSSTPNSILTTSLGNQSEGYSFGQLDTNGIDIKNNSRFRLMYNGAIVINNNITQFKNMIDITL